MRWFFLVIGLWLSVSAAAEVTIMSYNVENFFHPSVDSLNPDRDYTPDGPRRWSYARFYRKTEQIARVIASVTPDSYPDFVALNEVESDSCLIRLCRKMPHYPYRFIHFDSPDKRGIDVALLYDSTRFRLISAKPVPVCLPQTTTRDLLYASFTLGEIDTIHIIACHLPSQVGGYKASQPKRDTIKALVRYLADSILLAFPASRIIVCGDMNMPPKDDLQPLRNLMPKTCATHKFRGIWICLDQFYVSESLLEHSSARVFDARWLQEEDRRYLDLRPKRTFVGFRYNRNGFSDHLPILLTINL